MTIKRHYKFVCGGGSIDKGAWRDVARNILEGRAYCKDVARNVSSFS